MKSRLKTTFQLLVLACFTGIISAQSIRTEFGKNRVQYHDDFTKWWMYETENFIIYWYGKGRNVAQVSVQVAEFYHQEIQDIVEHRINDKIEIIVYTDISDLLQSNIGTTETFETRNQETKVIGSRLFVFFDGNHRSLKRLIREGIAQVYLNSMYSKKGLQKIVDSDPDLEIPNWYLKGFVSYVGDYWNPHIEDELRELWRRHKSKYHSFDRLSRDHPRVAGHSLWRYLEEEYGRTSITTLLYLMRLRNDFDENIEFVFGFDFDKLKEDWERYFHRLFEQEEDVFTPLPESEMLNQGFDKYFPKSLFRLHPSGESLVYVVNRQGKYKVYHLHLASGEKKIIFQHGKRNAVQQTDYNYPLIAWHESGRELTICYENKDKILLRKLNPYTGEYVEQEIPENFQRIYSIDYITNEDYLISANTDGFSDLYIYKSRQRQHEQLTDDFYDDIDASYVQLGSQWGILFSSNRKESGIIPERLDTILPIDHFDVFFLPLGGDFALRLTDTPDESERMPRITNGHFLTFKNDRNGVENRWVVNLNSRRRQYISSNYPRNIINHEAIPGSDLYIFQTYDDEAYQVYITRPNWNTSSGVFYTTAANDNVITEEIPSSTILPQENLDPSDRFKTKFDDPEYIEPLETNARFRRVNRIRNIRENDEPLDQDVIEFISARAVASRRQFKLEDVITKVDNEILFDGLESYADERSELDNQETGLLVKGIVKDIFEDFNIELGGRFPLDLKGSEFFTILDDNRKRLDRRYALYRKQETMQLPVNNNLEKLRNTTFIALHRMSYPFDAYRSVRLTGSFRVDKTFFLKSDPIVSEAPDFNEQRVSLKAEYVYDNTLPIDLNIRHGTRYKAYLEVINRFDLSIEDGFDIDFSKGQTTIVGFDFRHYVPVLRNSVLALRAAGASSFGSDKMLYYVGGTDGAISPKFNQMGSVPTDQNFAFKVQAPNLRGFDVNVRNGRSFGLASAELRIPIVKYLFPRELKSKFLRNIQLVGFVDAGSAWHGIIPRKRDNPSNTVVLNDTPGVQVTLNLDRSNFVYGYGFGARINLLGYFIRGDYAWGVESGLTQDPKLHLSLGVDF